MRGWLSVGCLLLGCAEISDSAVRPAGQVLPILYDDDNRIEVFAARAQERSIAVQAIVAVIPRALLGSSSDVEPLQLLAVSHGDAENLCAEEAFLDQPAAAVCSAVLLEPDLVLTAGHCVARLGACEDLAFVFDYYYRSTGELEAIHPNDLSTCRRIVAQGTGELDYAFVELERPAYGRRPLEPEKEVALAVGDRVTVIGTPAGLPLKVELESEILSPTHGASRFTLASDTFEGSSGSAVLTEDGSLLGIIVRGSPDYETSDAGCQISRRTSSANPSSGEQAVYVRALLARLCEAGWKSKRLCLTVNSEDIDSGVSPAADDVADDAQDASTSVQRASAPRANCSIQYRPGVRRGRAPPASSIALLLLAGRLAAARRRVRGSARTVRSR